MGAPLRVLPWQAQVLSDTISAILACPAGIGSGKTRLIVEKTLHVGWLNSPVPSMVVGPTFGMLTDNVLPQFFEVFEERKIRHRWVGPQGGGRKSSTLTVVPGGGVLPYDILIRSADDPKKLDGKNLGFVAIDECGQCKKGTIDRVRRRVRHPLARVHQLLLTGTPEDLGEYYDWCEGKPQPGTRLVRANTEENGFLPPGYIETTLSHLDEEDRQQYMRGFFITRGSRVYRHFDRGTHVVPCEKVGNERIHVGADFNVAKCSWVASVVRGEECHVFDEIIGWDTTTEEQGDRLTRQLRARIEKDTGRRLDDAEIRRRTTIYADPSAKNRSTRASKSDVEQLRAMGFEVQVHHTIIPIKDRVSTMNARLKNKHLLVDPKCAYLIKAMEQQQRDRNGDPEKDGDPKKDMSAETDACGYLLWGFPHWRSSMPRGNSLVLSSYV